MQLPGFENVTLAIPKQHAGEGRMAPAGSSRLTLLFDPFWTDKKLAAKCSSQVGQQPVVPNVAFWTDKKLAAKCSSQVSKTLPSSLRNSMPVKDGWEQPAAPNVAVWTDKKLAAKCSCNLVFLSSFLLLRFLLPAIDYIACSCILPLAFCSFSCFLGSCSISCHFASCSFACPLFSDAPPCCRQGSADFWYWDLVGVHQNNWFSTGTKSD